MFIKTKNTHQQIKHTLNNQASHTYPPNIILPSGSVSAKPHKSFSLTYLLGPEVNSNNASVDKLCGRIKSSSSNGPASTRSLSASTTPVPRSGKSLRLEICCGNTLVFPLISLYGDCSKTLQSSFANFRQRPSGMYLME